MAYTQWESRNIDKKKNIIEFRGTGDKPTGNYIGENSTLLDYDSGNKFYWKDGTWKPLNESSSGGSSGGEGLPADFPAEGSENANKFLGFDANGDYAAKDVPSGGGAEKFVVTLTQDEQTEEWTADKTIAEIVAAYDEDQIVVCRVPLEDYNVSVEIPCWCALGVFAAFDGVVTFDHVLIVEVGMSADGGEDEVYVKTTHIPTSTYAPLIVTLTEDQQNSGTLVGDKTYGEVYGAAAAGRSVVLSVHANDAISYAYINSCGHMVDNGGTYFIALNLGNYIQSSGAENDYVSITQS